MSRRLDGLVGEEFFDLLLGGIESVERLGSDWVGFKVAHPESILRTEEFPDFPRLLRALGRFHVLMPFSQKRHRLLAGLERGHKLFLE